MQSGHVIQSKDSDGTDETKLRRKRRLADVTNVINQQPPAKNPRVDTPRKTPVVQERKILVVRHSLFPEKKSSAKAELVKPLVQSASGYSYAVPTKSIPLTHTMYLLILNGHDDEPTINLVKKFLDALKHDEKGYLYKGIRMSADLVEHILRSGNFCLFVNELKPEEKGGYRINGFLLSNQDVVRILNQHEKYSGKAINHLRDFLENLSTGQDIFVYKDHFKVTEEGLSEVIDDPSRFSQKKVDELAGIAALSPFGRLKA